MFIRHAVDWRDFKAIEVICAAREGVRRFSTSLTIVDRKKVALAAVGSIPDEFKGELAKAYIILKPGAQVSRESLVAHCRQHLAAYKVPRAVQFVSSVPTTSSGKIMRRALKELDDGTFIVR
jgi:long-chain acyl-CoA synthetase